MSQKAVIFSAPSGSGKTTVVRYLLTSHPSLTFSISATTRSPRGNEAHGKDYFFLSQEEFEKAIKGDEFVEYEEVYPGTYYGTLKSEVERIWDQGNVVIFDVDVVGGRNLKKYFGDNALAVFIRPPSIDALRERLVSRDTDDPGSIEKRLAKAGEELGYEQYFDVTVVNDQLDEALEYADHIIREFLEAV